MTMLKSIGAVLGGLIAIFALSHVTDLILEKSGFMKLPFSTNPLWLMMGVTMYRTIYVVIGSYLAARLAPGKPMRHAVILGSVGFVLGIIGAVAMWHEPPHWYPVSLIVLGVPAAWLGGWLRQNH
jgi:hypothetical protein